MVSNELLIQEPKGGNLRDFLSILFKRKAAILTIFLTVVITVTIGSFLMSPTYQAESSLLVKFGREFIYRSEVGDKAPVIAFNQEEAINSEINILTSRDIIEQVIKTIKMENIYPDLVKNPPSRMTPLEAAVIAFQKKLTAEGVKKSSVIEVSFQHKDPKLAARAVNLLVDFFKEKHLQVHSGTESNFLGNQTNLYDQELKNSENRLEAFKQKNRIFSLDEQRSLLLKQRTELDTTLKNTRNRMDELSKKLASLRGQMKTLLADKNRFTQTERDKIIVEARARLLNLQLSEQDLASKYPDNNRLLVNIRKEVQIIKDFLREQEEAIGGKVQTANPVYQEAEKEALTAEAEAVSLRAKAVTLQAQIGQLDNEIKTQDLREKDLLELKREVSTNDKNFRIYQDKKEEARISDEMNRQKLANISVIQAAVVPSKPVKPKKVLNILLSIILGAVSGLGFAFLSEYTSQRFSSPDSVEQRLGLPVLVTIPFKEFGYRRKPVPVRLDREDIADLGGHQGRPFSRRFAMVPSLAFLLLILVVIGVLITYHHRVPLSKVSVPLHEANRAARSPVKGSEKEEILPAAGVRPAGDREIIEPVAPDITSKRKPGASRVREQKPAPAKERPGQKPNGFLLTREVREGETLFRMTLEVYGASNPKLWEIVRKKNPWIKEDLKIKVGQKIIFPDWKVKPKTENDKT